MATNHESFGPGPDVETELNKSIPEDDMALLTLLRNFLLRLPAELKCQMVSYLTMEDIRSLRLTSASDHAAVILNESNLVAGWLKRPLYAFAFRLFPAEPPEDRLKFDYFRKVCRRCHNVEKIGKGVAVKSFGGVVDSTKFANVHQNL